MRQYVWLGCALALASPALGGDVVWDNGAVNLVNFNGADTYLGYSSGNVGAGLSARYAAQAFTMPAGYASIDQIDASWFASAGSEGADIRYIVWSRTSMGSAPTQATAVASGSLGAWDAGIDDPRIAGTDSYLHQYTGLNITLAPGDYWLTMYADGIGIGNTTGLSYLNWLSGAPGVDSQITYNDFMWRSSDYWTSGFAQYAPANILPGAGMTDPTDRWNTSFVVYAVPAPGAAALLGFAGALGVRRRR